MATLSATLDTLEISKHRSSIKCYKTKQDLGIKASASEEFFHVRVPLSKIALAASSKRDGNTVIIDRNVMKVGKTACSFVPKLYILQGHSKIAEMKASGELFVDAWLGAKAMKKLEIKADDAISSNDLANKLSVLLQSQYPSNNGGGDCCSPGGSAWIRDVYPFENYFIFDRKGDHYRQAFVVDPVTRDVALSGKPVKVYEEYSETPKGLSTPAGAKASLAEKVISATGPQLAMPIMPSSGITNYVRTLSQERQFDNVNNSPVLGAHPGVGASTPETYINFGAPTSELNNPPLRTMTNIEEALQMYLADLADGTHKALNVTASSSKNVEYINARSEAELIAKIQKSTINVDDFIIWQSRQLAASRKTRNGLPFSYFGDGDREDPSTWVQAAGNVNSGKKKFNLGDRVKTKFGVGRVTDHPSRDTVEVTHAKGGKRATLTLNEVEAA